MLVLSRNVGQAIIIDDDIEVIVLGVSGRQIRLGVAAKPDVEIWREELYDKAKGSRSDPDAQ